MNNSQGNTYLLLDLIQKKAGACADRAALASVSDKEWQRQAREWREFAQEIQKCDALAPLVPQPPRRRF